MAGECWPRNRQCRLDDASPAIVMLSLPDRQPSLVETGKMVKYPSSFIIGVRKFPGTEPDRRTLFLLVGLTAVFVAISYLVSRVAAGTGVLPHGVIAAVVIAGCLLYGGPFAVAAGVGHFLFVLLAGELGFSTLFEVAGFVVAGALAWGLWGKLGRISSGAAPGIRSFAQLGEFAVVSVLAIATFAATIAWGHEILGLFPFVVVGPALFASALLATIVVGVPILALFAPRLTRTGAPSTAWFRSGVPTTPDQATAETTVPWWQVVTPIAWLVTGTVISASYQIYQLVSITSFIVRGLKPLHEFVDVVLYGPTGSRLQFLVGVVAFALVLHLVLSLRSLEPTRSTFDTRNTHRGES